MTTESSPEIAGHTAVKEHTHLDRGWATVVWDDPVNLMSYVTYVFNTYFRYPQNEAERLMMRVHTEGKAVVSTGGREAMERDVQAMHAYGLWATMSKES